MTVDKVELFEFNKQLQKMSRYSHPQRRPRPSLPLVGHRGSAIKSSLAVPLGNMTRTQGAGRNGDAPSAAGGNGSGRWKGVMPPASSVQHHTLCLVSPRLSEIHSILAASSVPRGWQCHPRESSIQLL